MHNRMLIYTVFFLLIFLIIRCSSPKTDEALREQAAAIHARVLTLDSHTDTPLRLMRGNVDLSEQHDPYKGGGKVDFPRMQAGGLDAVFFAVFIGQGQRTPEGFLKAKTRALEIFDKINAQLDAHAALAELALTPEDAYRLEKSGKRAVYIGIENGHPLGKDLSLIQHYYDLGARYITLCHTRNNEICDSSTDPDGPEHQGLTDFGKKVVAEMNRLGMLVDVSHISDESFDDVIETSQAPVIASHSCARALRNSPRNLTDDMLQKLAKNGGVIQICILSDYLKELPANPARDSAFQVFHEKFRNFDQLSEADQQKAREEWWAIDARYPQQLATVADIVDHIDHVVNLIGIDYVGIGTDFDGGGAVEDCFDVSQMGNITYELVKRGYSEEQIRKIWGGNFMRVFRKVMKVAEGLKN